MSHANHQQYEHYYICFCYQIESTKKTAHINNIRKLFIVNYTEHLKVKLNYKWWLLSQET